MKIGICDDNWKDTEQLKNYINSWSEQNHIRIHISDFQSAEEFLFYYPDDLQFDLIFIDIVMKKMNGIQLSALIREMDAHVAIVFITSYAEHSLCGYEVSALHYLLKPVSQDAVASCLSRAVTLLANKKSAVLHLISGKTDIILKLDQILYCIMFDHYIDIHTEDGVFTHRTTISKFEELLPPDQFSRCHRSYIVNVSKIKMIVADTVILDNQAKIPVSKNRIKKLNSAFLSYYK